MTHSGSKMESSPLFARRLRELTAALCDDAISDAEQAELENVLQVNEAARSQFLEDMCLHAGLEWDVSARGNLEALIESVRQRDTGTSQVGPATRTKTRLTRIAPP